MKKVEHVRKNRGIQHGVHKGGFTLIELMIVVAILGILAAIIMPQFGFNGVGASDPAGSKQLLETAYMYTDVEIIGANPVVCHQDDAFSTEFRAKNIKGQPVHGVVCRGYTGEQTVRFAP